MKQEVDMGVFSRCTLSSMDATLRCLREQCFIEDTMNVNFAIEHTCHHVLLVPAYQEHNLVCIWNS